MPIRWFDPVLWLGFFLVVLFTTWCAFVGWHTPIVQQYEFVQAKAALAAYYIAQGGPILRYELPVMGPPWSVPYEFPFYQVLSAWTHNLTGIPLESAGRVISRLFYYLSLIPLFVIGRLFGFRGKYILILFAFFLASPIYLHWSRQFMNESTATFFGLAHLAAAMHWEKRPKLTTLGFAIALGFASALAKSTTYAGFGIAVSLFFAWKTFSNRKFTASWLAQAFFVIAIPLASGLLWTYYTDLVKSENPFAVDTHTSQALASWYSSTDWRDRFRGPVWNHFFRITLHDAVGHRTVWILSLLLAIAVGRRARMYWVSSLLFLVAPLLFTKARMLHDYYAHANCVFLVFALALVVERAVTSGRKWLVLAGSIFFVLVIGFEVRDYLKRGYQQQQEDRPGQRSFALKLKEIVPPGEVVLFYGEDWCPVIPFYSERRAIMMQNWHWYHPGLTQSFVNLKAEGRKIGALVLCHNAKTDAELLKRIRLGPPILKDLCDVYTFVEPHLVTSAK